MIYNDLLNKNKKMAVIGLGFTILGLGAFLLLLK